MYNAAGEMLWDVKLYPSSGAEQAGVRGVGAFSANAGMYRKPPTTVQMRDHRISEMPAHSFVIACRKGKTFAGVQRFIAFAQARMSRT